MEEEEEEVVIFVKYWPVEEESLVNIIINVWIEKM